jgi:hypothetical protein
MAFTTINNGSDYFNTKLYTGNGSTQSITGVGFQPDWTWIKNRTSAEGHAIFDVVRGVTKMLSSANSDAETTTANSLTAFGSDGFSVGSNLRVNQSSNNIVSWNWKANGAGSANTDGSINSTVSVNQTAGFSISTFTTLSSTISTVGHGLGVIPDMVIVKTRANSNGWFVYHKDVGNNKFLRLETTGAETTNAMWNDTTPTSSVFSINANNLGASTSVAYCFAEKQGYSKFGSYVGNGNADGTFIYTGFKPAFIIVKRTNNGSDWQLMDNKRDPINAMDTNLFPNTNDVDTSSSSYDTDFLSNGFKFRGTSGARNGSGDTYIYMAFAEAPLVGTNDIPANAR